MTDRADRSRRHNVQIMREAAALVDSSPVAGNLVRIKSPKFVSLVGHPANQTGFKVVRDADGEQKEPVAAAPAAPEKTPVIRRTKRTDANPVLRLTFPEGTEETAVTEHLATYGMKDYKVTQENGVYLATRADLQSIAIETSMDIKLTEDGIMATITRAQGTVEPKSRLTMAAIEFDPAKYDEAGVADWLSRNSIDNKIAESENSAQAYVVRRSAVPENEEIRRMQLEDGVTAVIVRSDAFDIPDGYFAVVSETAYGSWGWGQLDFAATMADVVFSEQVSCGISHLEDVLRSILYWSPLPLDVRKALVNNALAQFSEYVGNLLDSLPRQLLVSVVRSANPQLENSMSKQNEGGATQTAAAGTAAATTAAPAGGAAATTPANDAPITRSELTTLVGETVAASVGPAIVAALEAAGIKRAEPTAAATEPAALTRSDITGAMAEVLKPLSERLEKLEGATTVRSAGTDAATEPVAPAKTDEQIAADKKSGAVFRGALGSLVNGRASATRQ